LQHEDKLVPAPSHIVGPTWRQKREGGWHLPEKTLGWGVLAWLYEYTLSPGGEFAGEPFLPTPEQARFIAWWYAVDETGRFAYRSGVLRRMKGWGKDPLAAALALAELCGPVAFNGFEDDGTLRPGKARHAAWIQLAAVSQEQTKNTMSLFPVMISKKMKDTYGVEVNKTVIYTAAGGRIEAVTSSPASMEGNRPTFVIRNETQWWVDSVQGKEMAGVIEGNVKKSPGGVCRVLDICNAHIPGEDSVAEDAYMAWQSVESGEAVDVGMLYDALEAPADTPVSEIPSKKEDPEGHELGLMRLREGLEVARGDSTWLDIETIVESVLDVRNAVTESRRKFLNQINASEDSWISPAEWDSCLSTDLRPLEKGDRITLGFDGSKSSDFTALVACRVEDGAIFVLKVWNPERYPNDEVPRDDVDAMVHYAFSRYEVVAMRADVKEFESYVDAWSAKYKKQLIVNASTAGPIAFDMRGMQKQFGFDCEHFLDAVVERDLVHDGNALLRTHILNAHRNPTKWDSISIRKASKDSSRKIDAAVCAVLAWGARQEVLMSGKNRSRKAVALRA
jgi:phage terminase large subunit-like protein